MPARLREVHTQDVLEKQRHHELEEHRLTRGVRGNHFAHISLRWHARRVLFEQTPVCHGRTLVKEAHHGITEVGDIGRDEEKRRPKEITVALVSVPQVGAVSIGADDVRHAESQQLHDLFHAVAHLLRCKYLFEAGVLSQVVRRLAEFLTGDTTSLLERARPILLISQQPRLADIGPPPEEAIL